MTNSLSRPLWGYKMLDISLTACYNDSNNILQKAHGKDAQSVRKGRAERGVIYDYGYAE